MLCCILFPDIENDAWRYHRWVGWWIRKLLTAPWMDQEHNVNLMFCVVTWVRTAPLNISAKSSKSPHPPPLKQNMLISPRFFSPRLLDVYITSWNCRESLKIIQLFTRVASYANCPNFYHILHEIVFKTLRLTNMCTWSFLGPKFTKRFSWPPKKGKNIFMAPLLLSKNFRAPPLISSASPLEVFSARSLREVIAVSSTFVKIAYTWTTK